MGNNLCRLMKLEPVNVSQRSHGIMDLLNRNKTLSIFFIRVFIDVTDYFSISILHDMGLGWTISVVMTNHFKLLPPNDNSISSNEFVWNDYASERQPPSAHEHSRCLTSSRHLYNKCTSSRRQE